MTAGSNLELRRQPITVVIATLGGPTLKDTIETINRGTIIPEEILVCIPRKEADRVRALSYPNLKVIVTDCRGQVAQRAIGFQNAMHEVVVQLDDDMQVDERCIELLLKTLETRGRNVAVSPSLVDLSTGESVYKKPRRNRTLEKIYYWVLNGSAGYEQGKIQKCGFPVGIDPQALDSDSCEAEWLAGGCVMHYRQNLVLENFYPFQGKAYCEDVIHSYHLRSKGIRLLVVPRAVCGLHDVLLSTSEPREFYEFLASDFRARRYFMRLASRASFRIYFFYFATCLSYGGKRITKFLVSKRRDAAGS